MAKKKEAVEIVVIMDRSGSMSSVRDEAIGGFTMAATVDGYIFNLYGQYNYGKDGKTYTNYAALESAFHNMANRLRGIGFSGTIGLPKIGAGTGGGDWKVIEEIIKNELKGWEVRVYSL